MSVPPPRSTAGDGVAVEGNLIRINQLTVPSGEAAAIARAHLTEHGSDGLNDLVRRAVPVGLLAIGAGAAGDHSGSVQRVLDELAEQVDLRSQSALEGLQSVLDRLDGAEQTAQQVLSGLPRQLEQVLAGESESVRASVAQACQVTMDRASEDIRRALDSSNEATRRVLSLDHDGPVQALRRDLLDGLDRTRAELAGQLHDVQAVLAAAQAKASSPPSTRAAGDAFQTVAGALAARVVQGAGDRLEETANVPGAGTTRRTGDFLAVLNRAAGGFAGAVPSIVLEAKARQSRRLTARQYREELARAREVRQATAGLCLVETSEDVPGGGLFARVDDLSFVVAVDQGDAAVSLAYTVLRELVWMHTARGTIGDTAETAANAKRHAQMALDALVEFDEIGRLAKAASNNLSKLIETGGRVRTRLNDALTAAVRS